MRLVLGGKYWVCQYPPYGKAHEATGVACVARVRVIIEHSTCLVSLVKKYSCVFAICNSFWQDNKCQILIIYRIWHTLKIYFLTQNLQRLYTESSATQTNKIRRASFYFLWLILEINLVDRWWLHLNWEWIKKCSSRRHYLWTRSWNKVLKNKLRGRLVRKMLSQD